MCSVQYVSWRAVPVHAHDRVPILTTQGGADDNDATTRGHTRSTASIGPRDCGRVHERVQTSIYATDMCHKHERARRFLCKQSVASQSALRFWCSQIPEPSHF